jgi:hypothetical protein
MARRSQESNTDVIEPEDVDVPELEDDDETETVVTADQEKAGQGQADPSKAASKPKNPRWAPPEGFLTPVGFAKIVTERKLHTPRGASEPGEVSSQMVYSYAKNAPKTDKFPLTFFDATSGEAVASSREDGPGETFDFPVAKERGLKQAVKVEDGIAWWERKNARVKERTANAATKAANKTEKGSKASSEPTVEAEDDEVVEKFDGDSATAVEALEAE